ncbi:hypothetical protein BDFB_003591 [Asbolus verrucosus]|uniref:Uncharacterized protein n=1 Tax=Asbolus verrucosus TaxID=1661398 RepID=A0A482W5E4_ASBVE|nr:hypothetical protein BDFB_003591 [Asbolus verrucosus]
MKNGHILCKSALKNFGNVLLLTLLLSLEKLEEKEYRWRTAEVVEEVRGLMEATPSKSIRKLS